MATANFTTATIVAYYNINTNTKNIMRNPTRLAAVAQTKQLETVSCLPFTGQKTATVRVKPFAELNSTKYLKITSNLDGFSWYGIVRGFHYENPGCVAIDLVVDGWMSCGGTTNITSISGITQRHHVTDDTFGKYNAPDAMLSCTEPLQMIATSPLFNYKAEQYSNETPAGSDPTKGIVIVVSAINLYAMGQSMVSTAGADTFSNGTGSVTVPALADITDAMYPKIKMTVQGAGTLETVVPSVAFFDGSDDVVQKGIRIAREMGQDSAIIYQYVIPEGFATITKSQLSIPSPEPGLLFTTEVISEVSCIGELENLGTVDTDFKYEYDSSVKNKRVLYGDTSKYGIIAIATGSKSEFNPEDLALNDTNNAPIVFCTADCRDQGTPMFRFLMIHGGQTNGVWFRDVVQGAKWQSLPLRFTERSGVGVDRMLFESQREVSNIKHNASQAIAGVGALASVAGGIASGNPMAIGAGAGALFGMAQNEFNYRLDRELEKQQFEVRAQIVAPQINFPQSESLRDLAGNGCVGYRLMPTATDRTRMDKILNMYGYADVKPLQLDDFTSMLYYNYVEANDVKITTNLAVPLSIIEIAQEQVTAGVRVWDVNPADSYYTLQNRPST